MPSFVIPILVLSAPAIALALFRRTWWWPLVMWALGMVIGQVMGWLVIADWVTLFADTVLLQDGLIVALWLVWSIVAAAGITANGSSIKDAASVGAGLGSFGASLTFEDPSKDNDDSGFLLTTMGTSLIHPGTMIGGLYFFTETWWWLLLWGLAVIWMGLDSGKWLDRQSEQSKTSTRWLIFGGTTLAVAFVLPQWGAELFLGTLPVWIWKSRQNFPWRSLLYVVGSFACVNLAVASGLPEVAAWGLEELPMDIHFALPVAILVASAFLSALVGSVPMAFFGVALFERLMDLPSVGLSTGPLLAVYGIGLVAGNIRPLVWVKAVRQDLFHWLLSSFVFINLIAVIIYKTF